jgi:hypothetical protein
MSRNFITPEQVSDLIPGLTGPRLAQLRYVGKGPRFYKPTPRLVLYDEADIYEWVEQSARFISGE